MLGRAIDKFAEVNQLLVSYFLVGEVVVMASNISQTSPYFVLLQNVINPAH